MKMQAFERGDKISVGFYGEDDSSESTWNRKVFYLKPKSQLSREQYLRELGFSYQASAGNGPTINFGHEEY